MGRWSILILFFSISSSLCLPSRSKLLLDSRADAFKEMLMTINQESLRCTACKCAVTFIHAIRSQHHGLDNIIKFSEFLCKKFQIASDRVCTSVVREFSHTFYDVFFETMIEPNELCGWFFGPTCAQTTDFYESWNISIPEKNNSASDDIDKIETQRRDLNNNPPFRILHLTDTHLDKNYKVGTKVDCGDPLCCRSVDPLAKKGEIGAPKYGYPGNCDTNKLLIHTLFENISRNHKDIDIIYWTGDVPSHNIWNQSKSDQTESIAYASMLLQKYFPGKKVFASVGNHEGAPVNIFPPPSITNEDESGQWLKDALAQYWGTWLPDETISTIKKGAYYTVLVRKGFRIVSLNMNYGNPKNWWLMVDSKDPAQQLEWFVEVLLQAEKASEKVHVIGHIPPDHCLKWFSYNYYRIIDRFHETIAGQFFGHTHHDEFRIFYDMKSFTKPISIGYVAPSITTFQDLNPGYRIYEVDGAKVNASWSVIDSITYFADLTTAMKTNELKIVKEYSAKELYKMKGLTPADWNDLINRFMSDDDLFQYFYKAYYKQHPKLKLCIGSCKYDFLCSMKTALAGAFHNFCNFKSKEHYSTYLMWREETYNLC